MFFLFCFLFFSWLFALLLVQRPKITQVTTWRNAERDTASTSRVSGANLAGKPNLKWLFLWFFLFSFLPIFISEFIVEAKRFFFLIYLFLWCFWIISIIITTHYHWNKTKRSWPCYYNYNFWWVFFCCCCCRPPPTRFV